MSKGPGKKNSRGMVMGMAFVVGLFAVTLEIWLIFRKQWELAEAMMADNPIFLFVLFGSTLGLPISIAMRAGNKSGKRIGDETEQIARSLRP